MTRNHNTTNNRDEVLFAFDQACNCPTAAQIIEWCERFPQFAEDIRAYAAISRELAARAVCPAEKADETMLARGFSRVLNLLYEAEKAVTTSSSAQSFEQAMPHLLRRTTMSDLSLFLVRLTVTYGRGQNQQTFAEERRVVAEDVPQAVEKALNALPSEIDDPTGKSRSGTLPYVDAVAMGCERICAVDVK